jgi:hypothetical protein
MGDFGSVRGDPAATRTDIHRRRLWLQAAWSAGARPSLAKASRFGMVAAPLAVAAALGALVLSGSGWPKRLKPSSVDLQVEDCMPPHGENLKHA